MKKIVIALLLAVIALGTVIGVQAVTPLLTIPGTIEILPGIEGIEVYVTGHMDPVRRWDIQQPAGTTQSLELTVVNAGSTPLSIVRINDQSYDWGSMDYSRNYIGPLAVGSNTTLTWTITVNAGAASGTYDWIQEFFRP